MKFVFLYSALIANILTNIGFKLAAINDAIPVKKWGYLGVGLVFGLINSILFTEALTFPGVKLGEASAVFFSLTIVGLYISGHFIFHEPIDGAGLLGGALIIAGVCVVSYTMK